MIYRKLIKNVLFSQYYEMSKKINDFFNRKLPLGLSIALAMLVQLSSAVLLLLVGIALSDVVGKNIIWAYFVLLGWGVSFYQARRDYCTYDSLYDRSFFVYGGNNKTAILANALAYGTLTIVKNPMVFFRTIFILSISVWGGLVRSVF